MLLPQNIQINITPGNVWAVLDAVESDFEGDLEDPMEGWGTEFVVEAEQKGDDKDKIKKLIPPFHTQINLYTQLYTSWLKITTRMFKMKKSMSPVMLWTVLLKTKMITWKEFIGLSLQGI